MKKKLRTNKHYKSLRSNYPYLYMLVGFLGFIFVGAILLTLPFATVQSGALDFSDSLFVATSAVCVTGLSTVVAQTTFTVFGKIVVAVLIQIGGLGFVTIAMSIFTLLGVKLGINDKFLLQEALAQNTNVSILKLLRKVLLITFLVEFYAFITNLFVFAQDFPFWTAVGVSAFHAVSTFNNAGFDIIGAESVVGYSHQAFFLINTAIVACLGGCGFFVIDDVLTNRKWRKLAFHSKVVLVMTGSLAVFGTLFVKLSDWGAYSWLDAFFMNMMTRSCGLTSIDTPAISGATVLILGLLMLIGSSPCGTGGGLKTTTTFVLVMGIKSFIDGKPPVVFYRRISQSNVTRAFLLTVLSILFICMMSFFVCLACPELAVASVFFEVVSAFGTVGLSMGITASLGVAGKLLLCIVMLVGRLGPLTVLALLNRNWNKQEDNQITYVEGDLMIG